MQTSEEKNAKNRAFMREYRRAHAAECYAKNRRWALANPDKVKEYHRRSLEKHPDTNRQSSANWRRNNADHKRVLTAARRAKIRGKGGRVSIDEWRDLCDLYAYCCACCGEMKPLTMDHVIPISKGGLHDIANIQPLCLSCNVRKGTESTDYRWIGYSL